MREIEIKPDLEKVLKKLQKKNKKLYKQVLKKIEEVASAYTIEHYKNLRNKMKDYKRVHIGHFVLIFSHNKTDNSVSFKDFDHHDKVYK